MPGWWSWSGSARICRRYVHVLTPPLQNCRAQERAMVLPGMLSASPVPAAMRNPVPGTGCNMGVHMCICTLAKTASGADPLLILIQCPVFSRTNYHCCFRLQQISEHLISN